MCESKNEIIGEVWEELKLMLDIYVKKNLIDIVDEHMRRSTNIQNEYMLMDNIDDYTLEDIGDYTVQCNLKEYLAEKGISQSWLCEKTNIKRGTLTFIMNKPCSASLLNIFKISFILREPIEVLFKFVLKSD